VDVGWTSWRLLRVAQTRIATAVVAAVRDVNERHGRSAVGTDRRRATRSEEAAQERTRDGTLALGTGGRGVPSHGMQTACRTSPTLGDLQLAYLAFKKLEAVQQTAFIRERATIKVGLNEPPFAHGPIVSATFASVYELVRKLVHSLMVGGYFGPQEDLGMILSSAFSLVMPLGSYALRLMMHRHLTTHVFASMMLCVHCSRRISHRVRSWSGVTDVGHLDLCGMTVLLVCGPRLRAYTTYAR